MMLSERCRSIVTYLLQNEKHVKVADLARDFNVSSRTIRYDLDQIDEWLKQKNIALHRKPRVGVWIADTAEAKEKLSELISEATVSKNLYLSPEERQNLILSTFFQADVPITALSLAEKIDVSRSTVFKDLEGVERWLNDRDIELQRIANKGMQIKASESRLRKGFLEYIYENFDQEKILDFLRNSHLKSDNYQRINYLFNYQINEMFKKIDVDEIEKIIKHLEKQLNVHFADTAFAGLMIHIAIAIERLRRNEKIEMPIEQLENLQKTQEFLRLKDLMKVVESTYKITIPDTEIGYITVHVLGAKLRDHFHNDNKAMTVQNDEKIIEIIDLFIRQVSIDLNIDLSMDFELRKGLYIHIRPALERLKYGLENHNPLLDDIFKYYLAIFEICSVRIKVFEEAFAVTFNTDEIGYIVLHIGSALERLNEQPINQAIRVIIVCGSGIGTAKMLSSRIRKELPELEIVAELSVLELDDPVMDRADYIISSITISRSLKIPCINVSPLLTVEDMNALRRIFGRHDHSYHKTKSQYEALMEIIVKNCQIIDDQQLQRDILSFLNGDSISTQWGLMDFLNALTITCKIEANNLEEAIRQTAQPLLKRKWIENNYVKRVIKNCKRLPQHFVLMQGLVMPHAETGNDVLRTSMSLGILKEPFSYGDSEISVILLLAVRENNYEKAMEEVLIILEDEALIQKLSDCDKGDEVAKVITNILDQSQ